MMKRSACLFLLAAMIAVPSAARAEDACEKIVMTGHPDYPAMAYRAGDRIDGAAPALVAAIAEDLGVPLVSRYLGSWSEAQEAAREGKADMIVGVYRNDEREKYLDYAEPAFAYDTVVVFVVAGYRARDASEVGVEALRKAAWLTVLAMLAGGAIWLWKGLELDARAPIYVMGVGGHLLQAWLVYRVAVYLGSEPVRAAPV